MLNDSIHRKAVIRYDIRSPVCKQRRFGPLLPLTIVVIYFMMHSFPEITFIRVEGIGGLVRNRHFVRNTRVKGHCQTI